MVQYRSTNPDAGTCYREALPIRDFLASRGIPSVSYTHLDVYKRQLPSCLQEPCPPFPVLRLPEGVTEMRERPELLLPWQFLTGLHVPPCLLYPSEKLRLKQLTDSNIYQPDKPLEITVTTDKENKTITICLLYTSRCV